MNNHFMTRAIQLSIENARSARGGPFGAVVARGTGIIAEGANEVTVRKDPTAHAEIIAIRTACETLHTFALRGCDLYASCEPCPMCLGAIHWARIARVFFASTAADATQNGFDDSAIYREIAKPVHQREIPMVQIMRDEALEAFHIWHATPNKTPY
jgi:tRNA(Arg) A34 adenosine deaminase TadA